VGTVQRIVCGGCLDFKIITTLPAGEFGKWEEGGFGPEKEILEGMRGIEGVSNVETQTFTIEKV